MTTVSYAVVGALVALLFAVVMIFKVMPQADHIVKKNYGPTEACCFTRCCFMVILLPWYVFTIWMAIVVMFDKDGGIAVMDELCADFSCARGMAFGLEQLDKDACTTLDCEDSDIFDRQGSKPDGYGSVGLGPTRDFSRNEVTYTCVGEDCESITSEDGETCACEGMTQFECLAACESGLSDFSISDSCLDEDCTKVLILLDADQEYMNMECDILDGVMECTSLTVPYYYPNIFFAISMVILFVVPVMLITYSTLKTQLKKIFKCNEMTLYIYSQEAGVQRENTAENIATGGYTNAVEEKHKYRTCGIEDIIALTVGPALIILFCWLIIISAGYFGIVFISMAFGFLLFQQLYVCQMFKRNQRAELEDRVKENNNNAAYF